MKPTIALGAIAAALALAQGSAQAADILPVTEDVMTSSFFQGANTVRGYAVEATRPVLRVSTDNPAGTTGAETIYLSFAQDFSAYSGPVSATLTMQSTAGGFGMDASAATPFLVSAHAVDANPFTTITDDTNPGGTTSWLSFYRQHILPSAAGASTLISGEGAVSFDVSAIVNGWITGAQSVHAIALTGLNDTSGNAFLHGFLNNNNAGTAMGYTFLTVTAVPEPGTWALFAAGLAAIGMTRASRRRTA